MLPPSLPPPLTLVRLPARALVRALSLLGLWLGLLAAWPSMAAEPLLLDDRERRIEAWPSLTMLSDPGRQWTLQDVQDRRRDFAPPTGAAGSLGLRRDAVWLRLPVVVAPDSEGQWVLDIAYAVLNRADVWLLRDGEAPRHWVLGNRVPRAERPLDGRSHALPLHLPPGTRAELVLRLETAGAMIVPITLGTPSAFLAASVDEQMLQGLLTGLGLFLVLYSLTQWWGVREPMFWRYALLTSGSVMFSVTQFGLGSQYLWGDFGWFEAHMAGLSALLASTGTCLFVQAVLAAERPRSAFSRLLYGCAAGLLLTAAAYGTDLIDVHVVSAVVGTLGLAPALLGLPGAFARWRRRDPIGGYFIVAWLGYFIATWFMVGLVQGRQPAHWATLHVFQFGATLDMLLFLRVLSLRMGALHADARAATRERARLHTLAHTDVLTGLPNRRGLEAELARRLEASKAGRVLSLHMLDLDGFKQVNDRHGHDVGDALLVAVAQRLRAHLREQDLVARLGGDEFVVVADGLRNESHALTLSRHLQAAFDEPFAVDGQVFPIGLTAGFVLAPNDGTEASALLKAADTALLSGKRAGKGQVRRGAVQPVS